MTDEEQQAWDEDGIGTPPSRDPAKGLSVVLFLVVGLLIAAFAISALAR